MDFLVQRALARESSWEDVAVVRDLKADEAEQAVTQALRGVPPLSPGQPDHGRAIQWDAITEFDVALGDPQPAERQKKAPGPNPT